MSNLFQILRSGDIEAFERLYTENYALVRDYLVRWDDIRYEDAEEIAQDVMVVLWESRHGLWEGDNKQFFRYIYTMAKRMAIKVKLEKERESGLRSDFLYDPDILSESPEEMLVFSESIESISKIIDNMPKIRRRVFELKFNEGYSNEKIAQELNITLSTVRSHIQHIFQDVNDKI